MSNNIIGNLLSFNKMISEQIIKIVYYVGLLGIALTFIYNVYESFTSGVAAFLPMLLASFVTAILAVLLWRVICEVIIIIFRVYARLGDINEALGGKNIEAAIPGDKMLNEMRDAALKAKTAAAEKAKTLKSSISKDSDDLDVEDVVELKPAAKTPAKKPAAKKTTAKKTTTKEATTATKTPAKKTTTKTTTKK